MKNIKIKVISIVLLIVGSQGCGSDNNPREINKVDESNRSVFDAITSEILFSGGSVLNGSPPKATNNPGDAYLTVPSDTPVKLKPSSSGELSIKVNDMPAGQNFNVNVQFGSSNQYIIIPIDNSNGIVESIANSGGTGTLNIPFSLPPNICDSIDGIQHQIECYESVDIGRGTMVSKQTARQMLLACGNGSGDFATGANDYCVDDYPREACSILNDQNLTQTSYKENQTCSSAFPQSTIELNIDVSCSNDGFSSSCGACAIEYSGSNRAVDLKYTVIEDVMNKQFEEYLLNPEARRSITFIPTEPTQSRIFFNLGLEPYFKAGHNAIGFIELTKQPVFVAIKDVGA